MNKEKIIDDLKVILRRTDDLHDSIELLISDLEKQSQYPQNDNVDYGLIEDIIRKIVNEPYRSLFPDLIRTYPQQPIPQPQFPQTTPQNPIIQPYVTYTTSTQPLGMINESRHNPDGVEQ